MWVESRQEGDEKFAPNPVSFEVVQYEWHMKFHELTLNIHEQSGGLDSTEISTIFVMLIFLTTKQPTYNYCLLISFLRDWIYTLCKLWSHIQWQQFDEHKILPSYDECLIFSLCNQWQTSQLILHKVFAVPRIYIPLELLHGMNWTSM